MNRIDYFNKYWHKLNSLDKKTHTKLIDLGMGMPDQNYFRVPIILTKKLHESIDKNDFVKYCRPEGNPQIISEIVDYENSQLSNDYVYSSSNVIMTPGAISSFAMLVDTLLNPKDEILILSPSYFSLAGLSELKANVNEVVSPSLNFDFQFVKKNVSLKTKLIFLCNPNNPTGLFFPTNELKKLIKWSKLHDIFIVIDESCRNYIFKKLNQRDFHNVALNNIIRIKSFSKEQNLSGYRIGYILANNKIIASLKKIIPVLYGNATLMADRAILTELKIKNGKLKNSNYNNAVSSNLDKMNKSRNLAFNKLVKSNKIEKVIMPEACYYMFVKCKFAGNSFELFERLVDKAYIDVCPGVLFGLPKNEPWIRICFARKSIVLNNGINKLLEFLNEKEEKKKRKQD